MIIYFATSYEHIVLIIEQMSKSLKVYPFIIQGVAHFDNKTSGLPSCFKGTAKIARLLISRFLKCVRRFGNDMYILCFFSFST